MNEILPVITQWIEGKHLFAIATVTHTAGSSPRGIGSSMAIRRDGLIVGSVSGGCIEAVVVQEALTAIEAQTPKELKLSANSGDELLAVSMPCGGEIGVLIELPPPYLKSEYEAWTEFVRCLNAGKEVVWITSLTRPGCHLLVYPDGTLLGRQDELKDFVPQALELFADGNNLQCHADGQRAIVCCYKRRRRLIIVGASHVAVYLTQFAKAMDFEVTIVDPRSTFIRRDRFPAAPDKILVEWPAEAFDKLNLTEEVFAVVTTHDPKIDEEAVRLLLRSRVSYVGILGNKNSQKKRKEVLIESGFSEEAIEKIYGPIGLDIGARTPSEIALSIMAEIICLNRSVSVGVAHKSHSYSPETASINKG